MTSRRTPLLWTTSLLLLVSLFTTALGGFVRAAPPLPSPSLDNIVISEFRTRGDDGVYDEFVELFNPTGGAIDISGWILRYSGGCSTSTDVLVIIDPGTSLTPGQHYLVASEDAAGLTADQTYTPSPTLSLVDNGGIALFDPDVSPPIDAVGLCADTEYVEGAFLDPLIDNITQGYERLPGGSSGNCTDSDDNDADFLFVEPGDPQNSDDSPTSTCIPATPTRTYTRTPTPGQAFTIVISEFRTRGTNGGQDELVELYNPTFGSVNIGGWQVLRSSGCGVVTSPLFTIPAGTWLAPGRHFLAASADASLSIPPDLTYVYELFDNGGFALLNGSGQIVDQVGMCASTLYLEGTFLPALTDDLDQGYEREPGGALGACHDSGDNFADFHFLEASLPQNMDSAPVFCTGVSTSTPTLTPTFTPTFAGTTNHVVISEFRTRGTGGANDEFVELYNPTGAAVLIGGWTLRHSQTCGSITFSLLTITSGMILQPGQHYLMLSSTNSSLTGADQTFVPAIADEGGIALLNASGTVIDQVGLCAATAYREGTFLAPLTENENQGYERRLGGSTSCQDTNNNFADFFWLPLSNPQNRLSTSVLCAGVSTYTPTTTFTRTRTPTRTATATATTLPGNVILNEFLPRPASDWDASGEANSRDEYIELINMGTTDISIANWKLDDIAEGGSNPFTLPAIVLAPRQIVRFYASETGISLSDGGDTVRLLKPDGRTADLRNYSIVTLSDQTWCRLPDGSGAWAFVCRPTPGRPNALIASAPTDPGEGRPVVRLTCFLPDTAPQAFWLAECDSSGADLWEQKTDLEFWLGDSWKWGVFIK